jgi:hypothetical protein
MTSEWILYGLLGLVVYWRIAVFTCAVAYAALGAPRYFDFSAGMEYVGAIFWPITWVVIGCAVVIGTCCKVLQNAGNSSPKGLINKAGAKIGNIVYKSVN